MMKTMISIEEALAIVCGSAAPIGIQRAPLSEAWGRVLAEDAVSDVDMPPFDKSAVDGYAVRADDVRTVPVALEVAGEVSAGGVYRGEVGRGRCVKIMTGASVPRGADAVVMVEDTEPAGEGSVLVRRKAGAGSNVCARGEDTAKGEKVLSRGTVIGAPETAILASVGKPVVEVYRRPSAAVLSTGNEIVEPRVRPGEGKIRNSNGPMLLALARAAGCDVRYLGIAGDDERSLSKALSDGLESDLLLVSGGVSMGDYDLVPAVLKRLGVEILFHKVRVKPGKPLLFGRRGGCLVFGVPGNPVSNFTTFVLFVRPVIERMGGREWSGLVEASAVLGRPFTSKSDRPHVVPAKWSLESARVVASPFSLNGSADIVACSRSDCFVLFPEGVHELPEGSEVRVIPIGL